MGKEGGELWDDSALINAFEKAINNYKIMHGKGGHESSFEGGKVISSTEQNLSAPVEESNEAKRDLESDDMNNAASNHTTEIVETINPLSVKGSHSVDAYGPGHYMSSSNDQNVHNSYLNTQCVEDYNHLLNQYYELEEQRQKILQQLYQFGSWNYQGSDSSVQWGTFSASQERQVPAAQASCQTDSTVQLGTTSASQEHQVPAAQASYPTVACCCFSHVCPCLVGPCTSLPACTSGGACTGKLSDDTSAGGHNGISVPIKEDDLIKKVMGAADRALSSLRTNASGGSDIGEDKETMLETEVEKLQQGNSTETDLTVVFNAWYSAGFYTFLLKNVNM